MKNYPFLLACLACFMLVSFASIGVYETFIDEDPQSDVTALVAEVGALVDVLSPGMIEGNSCNVTLNDTTATKIVCGVGQRSYECTVDSAETDTAYIGGANITTSIYRRTATGGDRFGADTKFSWGLSSSGNITLHCGPAVQ